MLWLQTIMNSNPQLRAMADTNPEIRSMLSNPEAMRAMMNPETMGAMVNMQRVRVVGFGKHGRVSACCLGSSLLSRLLLVLQRMRGLTSRSSQAVQQLQSSGAGNLFGGLPAAGAQPGGAPAAGGVPNLAGLLGMLNAGGMGGMGGMPAAPPPVANPEEAYATQIQQLVDMV